MRVLRYLYRVPLLLWHVVVDLPLTLLAITLPAHRIRLHDGERLDHRLIRAWQSGLMRVFGIRMGKIGTPLPGATVFVANHVSWIDIVALHSQRMMGFVAKREIAGWPVVGWLATRGETIYHQRGNTESLGGVLHEMLARLRAGRSVGVFPEGRTRSSGEIGPFHARIFLAAVEANVPVQPVALRYGANGDAQHIVAFQPKETFASNFLRLLGEPPRSAEAIFLEPIPAGGGEGRRRIAELARERIMMAMGDDGNWSPGIGAQQAMPCGANSRSDRMVSIHGIDCSADYRPPRWLRDAHVQSILGSSPLRRLRGARVLRATGAVSQTQLVDGGDRIRLQGVYSRIPGMEPRGLALLLHGWEGSAESSYMRLTAAHLLDRGFATFRLNFRDHGETHHLNEALFHSNRIDEVVHAAGDIAHRFGGPQLPLVVAGYSLGGNFALRLALHAIEAGLSLTRVAAVCPVLDPARTMTQMERGPALYLRYFERKWRRSLLRKRALFPQRYDFDDATIQLGMRELTRWLVEHHTDFGTLDNYFAGYSIAADRLSALAVPADILMAQDDPVIPVAEFNALQLPDIAWLHIVPWGGHCGFLQNACLDGYAERWVAQRLGAVLVA